MRRVAITGLGIISPIGNSVEEVRAALLEGRSGIRAMPEWASCKGLHSLVAGAVQGIEPKQIPRVYRRTMGRVAVMAALAARQAAADAGLGEPELASDRAGVVLGSTMGSSAVLEQFFGDFSAKHSIEEQEGTTFMKVMGHTVAANVAAMLGVKGWLLAPSCACASSTQAIALGWEAIRHGSQDLLFCGGADDLHIATAGVFDVVHAASKGYNDAPGRTPRPFDRRRDGLVVSEGAAVVVLEDYERARARGAAIHGEVLGCATSSDARHMASPSAQDMLGCMRAALRAAGASAADLDYVNAHATATELGDAAEAAAIRELLGDSVPVSGTKGYTGHTMAACGAMELIFSLVMLRDGFLAPTLNLEEVAPDCAGLQHLQKLLRCQPELMLSNNFAFGGVSAALVFGKG